jgi:hypothetical protein
MKTFREILSGLVFISAVSVGQVYRTTNPDVVGSSKDRQEKHRDYDRVHDELVRCVSYSVVHDTGGSTDQGRVKVTAQNSCSQAFGASDSRFEITATANNGAQEREVGMFQGQIPPQGQGVAETFISVPCPGSKGTRMNGECQYSVSVWWAATGGR